MCRTRPASRQRRGKSTCWWRTTPTPGSSTRTSTRNCVLLHEERTNADVRRRPLMFTDVTESAVLCVPKCWRRTWTLHTSRVSDAETCCRSFYTSQVTFSSLATWRHITESTLACTSHPTLTQKRSFSAFSHLQPFCFCVAVLDQQQFTREVRLKSSTFLTSCLDTCHCEARSYWRFVTSHDDEQLDCLKESVYVCKYIFKNAVRLVSVCVSKSLWWYLCFFFFFFKNFLSKGKKANKLQHYFY